MTRRNLLPAIAVLLSLAVACGGGDEPVTLTLTTDLSQLPAGSEAEEALGDAADVLRRRAEQYGAHEPQITPGSETISVTLEGISLADATDLMTRRGIVEFKREETTTDGFVVCETLEGETFVVPPLNVNPDDTSRSLARCFSEDRLGEPVWIDAELPDEATGEPVKLAREHVEPGGWESRDGGTALAITFTGDGAALLEDITRILTGYHLGLFVDGTLVGAPRIQRAITDGQPIISGFPAGQARILAATLNVDPLEISLTPSP